MGENTGGTGRFVLVWRDTFAAMNQVGGTRCKFCEGATHRHEYGYTKERDGIDQHNEETQCLLCGWRSEIHISDVVSSSATALKMFDLNSPELALSELGTHLSKKFEDLYNVAPLRFEELVGDIFKDHNHEPVFTKKTRDGGVDIFLLDRTTQLLDLIIQCKRYKRTRKVGIDAVQRLAGAALHWKAKRAVLVTSSAISRDGCKSATEINRDGRIELDFVEADELLRLLGVYNVMLPPLDNLTEDKRRQIIEANQERMDS